MCTAPTPSNLSLSDSFSQVLWIHSLRLVLDEGGFDGSASQLLAHFSIFNRICPGRHLADNTVYMAAASILKVFNISHAKDPNGVKKPINVTFTSGAISCVQLSTRSFFFSFFLFEFIIKITLRRRPNPFECSITPRITPAELEYYQELYGDAL